MKMPWEINDAPDGNGPLTPAPRLDGNGPTAPDDSAISAPALQALSQSHPDLVEAYRAKMAGSAAAVKDAQDKQDMGDYANVAGKALNDFGNSQKRDVVLRNRMQNMGGAPDIVKANRPAYDPSQINAIGQQGLDRAKQQRAQDSQDFNEEQKLTDLGQQRADQGLARDKAARENDPTSPESQAAREYLKQVAPNSASIANFDKLTASQAMKIAPGLLDKAKIDETTSQRRDAAAARLQASNDASADRKDRRDAAADQKQGAVYSELNNKLVTPGRNKAVSNAQEALRNVSNAQELISQYPDPNQMPPDKVSLLNAEIAKIASGGVASEHGQRSLEANTLAENFARFQQKVGNAPAGAQLGEFIKANKGYLDGLAKSNQKAINDYQKQVYKGYKGRLSPEQQKQFEEENPDLFNDGDAAKAPMHGADLP